MCVCVSSSLGLAWVGLSLQFCVVTRFQCYFCSHVPRRYAWPFVVWTARRAFCTSVLSFPAAVNIQKKRHDHAMLRTVQVETQYSITIKAGILQSLNYWAFTNAIRRLTLGGWAVHFGTERTIIAGSHISTIMLVQIWNLARRSLVTLIVLYCHSTKYFHGTDYVATHSPWFVYISNCCSLKYHIIATHWKVATRSVFAKK